MTSSGSSSSSSSSDPPPPTLDSVVEALRRFFVTELLDGDERGLAADTHLLEAGLLDSMKLVKLSAFVAETWGLRIPFKELTPDNVKTLGALGALVLRLQQQQQQRGGAAP